MNVEVRNDTSVSSRSRFPHHYTMYMNFSSSNNMVSSAINEKSDKR